MEKLLCVPLLGSGEDDLQVLAATGDAAKDVGRPAHEVLEPIVLDAVQVAIRSADSEDGSQHLALDVETARVGKILLCLFTEEA